MMFGAGGELVEVLARSGARAAAADDDAGAAAGGRDADRAGAARRPRPARPSTSTGWRRCWCGSASWSAISARIREIDINPLLVTPAGAVALDARIVLHNPAIGDAELPRPAIRPYPAEYVWTETSRDGAPFTIRPIRPDDEPLLVAFHRTLSERACGFATCTRSSWTSGRRTSG
jgi:acetyltransferase